MYIIQWLNKITLLFFIFLYSDFNELIFHPSGLIAIQQHKLFFIVFKMMLCIVLPVICMTLFFVYSYRICKMNTYWPNWNHSNRLELVIWIIPCAMIVFLGILTWNTSHSLDPKKKIISQNRPIVINVIALDWKWLFIYSKSKVATLNEVIIPINTPIVFNITSHSVMSAFFIPALGSQLYAMPGMKSTLNLIANDSGVYQGFSSNYNGVGFSDMKFNTIVVPNNIIFKKWIIKIQNTCHKLDNINKFKKIEKPSILNKIKYFSFIYPNYFHEIIIHSF